MHEFMSILMAVQTSVWQNALSSIDFLLIVHSSRSSSSSRKKQSLVSSGLNMRTANDTFIVVAFEGCEWSEVWLGGAEVKPGSQAASQAVNHPSRGPSPGTCVWRNELYTWPLAVWPHVDATF